MQACQLTLQRFRGPGKVSCTTHPRVLPTMLSDDFFGLKYDILMANQEVESLDKYLRTASLARKVARVSRAVLQ